MELPHNVLYLDMPAQAGHLSGFLVALSRHPGGVSGAAGEDQLSARTQVGGQAQLEEVVPPWTGPLDGLSCLLIESSNQSIPGTCARQSWIKSHRHT